MPKKERIDVLLVNLGMVESRSKAQRLVMAGQVRADGQLALKPSSKVQVGASIEIDAGPRFVSRGGTKLSAAFDTFSLDVTGKICADIGASTGGFTDCLLQNGAARVYAVDVGKGILHWKIRKDPRVVVMENTNARFLESFDEPIAFLSIDVAFISLKILLPLVGNWFFPDQTNPIPDAAIVYEHSYEEQSAIRDLVMLIKPQFEAGRQQVARGKGVVRDPAIHRQVLLDVLGCSADNDLHLCGLIKSPIMGPKGNREFLAWLKPIGEKTPPTVEITELVDEIVHQNQG